MSRNAKYKLSDYPYRITLTIPGWEWNAANTIPTILDTYFDWLFKNVGMTSRGSQEGLGIFQKKHVPFFAENPNDINWVAILRVPKSVKKMPAMARRRYSKKLRLYFKNETDLTHFMLANDFDGKVGVINSAEIKAGGKKVNT